MLILLAILFLSHFLPQSPLKMTLVDQQQKHHFSTCPALADIQVNQKNNYLPDTFSLLNWNIYKQQNPQWSAKLNEWASQADLMTLQEAKYDQALIDFSQQQQLTYFQNIAFNYKDESYGVNTFSRVQASQACGTRYPEPWTMVPKTGIATIYPMADAILGNSSPINSKESLLLINLHGVNFTFTAEPLKAQVTPYLQLIKQHKGPILISGDFNTWSEDRTTEIIDTLVNAGFNETQFTKDKRLIVFGLPLDHVFYRGLTLIKAQSISTIASDHSPQLVTFALPKEK
nr:endonuclease/exonuclease/phosphatase family protein [Psychromonas sp. SP041]